MTEHEKRGWYSTDAVRQEELAAWYGGPSAAAVEGAADTGYSAYISPPGNADYFEKARKKKRRTKIISLSVCALFVAASVLTAVSSVVELKRLRARTGAEAPRAEEKTIADDFRAGYQKDYRDYFAEYYASSGGGEMAHAGSAEGVSVELRSQNGKKELTLQEVYELVNPAIVGVTTYRNGIAYGWGSGVIFTEDGYILINTHMIDGADAADAASVSRITPHVSTNVSVAPGAKAGCLNGVR